MNTMLTPRMRSRTASLLLYGLTLSLVLLAPALGMLATALAVWQALLAGSIWYMTVGLVMMLAVIAMVHSHKLFDLALLGLVVVAVIAWIRADVMQQSRLLDAIQALAQQQTHLMAGVLLAMILALVVVRVSRRFGRPGAWPRPIWIGLPVVMLLSISAAGNSMIGGL